MDIVFFGLEAEPVSKTIEEISAKRVSSLNGRLQVVDQFHSYVSNTKSQRIESLSSEISVKEAFQNMLNWIDDRDYYLFIWSLETIEFLAYGMLKGNEIPFEWIKNCNIIQDQISKKLNKEEPVGKKEFTNEISIRKRPEQSFLGWRLLLIAEASVNNLDLIDLERNTYDQTFSLLSTPKNKCKECGKEKFFNGLSCNDCKTLRKDLQEVRMENLLQTVVEIYGSNYEIKTDKVKAREIWTDVPYEIKKQSDKYGILSDEGKTELENWIKQLK